MATAPERCTATSGGRARYDPIRRCERPAVRDGLCQRHLAGKQRREANTARWQAERDAQDRLLRHVRDVADEFRTRFGVELQAHYVWIGNGAWDGKLVISEADLRKLVASG